MPSFALRVGAVVLAVMLAGAYVWFRVGESRKSALAGTAVKSPASAPARATAQAASPTVMSGTKFSRIYQDPYPTTNAIGAGFKLNNSISAEFAVGADTKVGIIDLVPLPQPSTQPTTTPDAK